MKLIFLDVDGVLNCHEPLEKEVECGRLHPDKVTRLNALLRDTDAQIVLSSAWRYLVHRQEMNLIGLGWLLRSHGILDRLVGVTRPDTMERAVWTGREEWVPCDNERGQQISDFLADSRKLLGVGCDRYVVLDDLDLGISAAGHPFVRVAGKKGLTWTDYDQALALLKG